MPVISMLIVGCALALVEKKQAAVTPRMSQMEYIPDEVNKGLVTMIIGLIPIKAGW